MSRSYHAIAGTVELESEATGRIGPLFSEFARIVILIAAGVGVTVPFLSLNIIGSGDAVSYATYAFDAIAQARTGTFPVYVGLTSFSFNGYPYVIWGFFYNVIAALDFLTLHMARPIVILNGVMVGFGVLHSVLAYLSLRFVSAAGRPWLCTWLAVLFTLCPGNVSILFVDSMYASFVATPFICPLLAALYLMTRRVSYRAASVAGLCTSLLCMAHFPTGLFALYFTVIILFAGFMIQRAATQYLHNAGVYLGVFILVSLWYFGSVLGMHGTDGFGTDYKQLLSSLFVPTDYIKGVIAVNRALWAAHLLPASLGHGDETIQLGYSLFVVLALVLGYGMRRRVIAIQVLPLLIATVMMFAFVIPLPGLSRLLLFSLPKVFVVQNVWLCQRLYRFIAAAVIIMAVISRDAILFGNIVLGFVGDVTANMRFNVLLSFKAICCLLFLLSVWSAFDLRYVVKAHFEEHVADTTLDDAHIIYASQSLVSAGLLTGHYDPSLFYRVVRRSDGAVIAANDQWVAGRCSPALLTLDRLLCDGGRCSFVDEKPGDRKVFARMTVPPLASAALRFSISGLSDGVPARVELNGSDGRFEVFLDVRPYRNIPVLTVHNQDDAPRDYLASFAKAEDGPVVLDGFCVAPYDRASLPIQVDDHDQVKVSVSGDDAMLVTALGYRPGFYAVVDGRPVEAVAVKRDLPLCCAPFAFDSGWVVGVPLHPGDNVLTFGFRPSLAIRIAFILSVLAGGLVLAFLVRGGAKKPLPSA